MKTESGAIALHLQGAARPPPPHTARFAAARFPRLPHAAGSGICPGYQSWSGGTSGHKLCGSGRLQKMCVVEEAGLAETGRREKGGAPRADSAARWHSKCYKLLL